MGLDAALKVDRDSVMAEIEENRKNVHEMIIETESKINLGKPLWKENP